MALAAAQLCSLGGEQNSFSSAHATVASGKDSWENEQLAPWGVACGLHLGAGGHQKLGKEAALCKAEFRVNSLYKGSDILLAPQHDAAIAKATATDQVGSIALIPRLCGAL